jgi:hypothetical protein
LSHLDLEGPSWPWSYGSWIYSSKNYPHVKITTYTVLGTNHLTWRGEGGLWFFVSFRIFFSDNTRGRIYFFCRAKCKFFFQNLTLGYMTKTLNQIIFFFLHQNQNIFFSNIGNQNIFLEKKHNPPFKLNGRSLRIPIENHWSLSIKHINGKWAIFQLRKSWQEQVTFDEIMMRSTLYKTNTLG